MFSFGKEAKKQRKETEKNGVIRASSYLFEEHGVLEDFAGSGTSRG